MTGQGTGSAASGARDSAWLFESVRAGITSTGSQEHNAEARADALAALTEIEQTVRAIARAQQDTLRWIQRNGIVFDGPLGTDPKNWENIAFSIYTDLCEVDSAANHLLAASE